MKEVKESVCTTYEHTVKLGGCLARLLKAGAIIITIIIIIAPALGKRERDEYFSSQGG